MRKKIEEDFTNDNRKIAIYARKSRATNTGLSIENQISECKRKAYYKFDGVTEEDFIIYNKDEGISGYHVDTRPDFKRMIKAVEDGKIKIIMAYKFDRVNRNTRDFLNFVNLLNQHNVKFISATQDFDSQTTEGKLMMTMMSGLAEWERDIIAERITDNLYDLAKKGRWLGGSTPTGFGYERRETIRLDGRPTTMCLLTPIPEEQETVKLLFKKYLELKSQCEVEYFTMMNNIKSKNNRYYTRTSIKRILLNPVYAVADEDTYNYFKSRGADLAQDKALWDGSHGVIAYKKTDQANRKSYIDVHAIDEWIIAIGEHKGIIPGKDWVKVQNLIWRNSDKNFRKPLKNQSILTGLIRCEHCGNLLVAKVTQRIGPDGKLRYDYACPLKLKTKGAKCNCANLNGNNIDKLILDAVKDLFKPNSDFVVALNKIVDNTDFVESTRISELREMEKRYNNNESSYNNLLEKLKYVPSELMTDITASMVNLKKENEEYAKKIRELKSNDEGVIKDKQTAKLILDLSEDYLRHFDELDTLTKRDFIRMFVSSITTDGHTVNMSLLSSQNVLPGNHRRSL